MIETLQTFKSSLQPFYLIFGITTTGGGGGQMILLGHPLSFDSSTESKF